MADRLAVNVGSGVGAGVSVKVDVGMDVAFDPLGGTVQAVMQSNVTISSKAIGTTLKRMRFIFKCRGDATR